jgi:hypothetical protein
MFAVSAPIDDDLKRELLVMDIQLRRKQVGWETPKNIVLLIAALAATLSAFGAFMGYLGYRAGREPPPPIVIQLQEKEPR